MHVCWTICKTMYSICLTVKSIIWSTDWKTINHQLSILWFQLLKCELCFHIMVNQISDWSCSEPGSSGGTNTQSHMGFYSDPEYVGMGREFRDDFLGFGIKKWIDLHSCLSTRRQQRSAEVISIVGCWCCLILTADWSCSGNILYRMNYITKKRQNCRTKHLLSHCWSCSEPASSGGERWVQSQTFWRNKHPEPNLDSALIQSDDRF